VNDELLWVYGVVPTDAPLPAGLAGIAGCVVRLVTEGGLAALVSSVPHDEFAAEPLRRNLNDLPWLERVAREHEGVQEQVLADTTIVPLRLCTIFDDPEGVVAMLIREAAQFGHALERLEGREEWGVKLLVDGDRLMAASAGPTGDDAQGEGGAAYLARRRREREAREAARSLAAQIADDVQETLRGHALGVVRLPPQNRELAGYRGDMLLNGAYLLDRDAVEGLRGAVEELRGRYAGHGAELVLTGPWPPYNFVTSGEAAQPA